MLGSGVAEGQLLDGFLRTLRALPGVSAEVRRVEQPRGRDSGHDAQVELRAYGSVATLLVELKKAVYPRDVRQVLWRIREFTRGWPHSKEVRQSLFFLVAELISPGAKELLRNERVGYFDSGGSLFLAASGIYVCVDKPPPKSYAKSVRSVFSDRRAQVLHTLLMRSREWYGVQQIASQARVSAATASHVLTELEKFEWVVSRGRGPGKERHLQEPGALLDEWVKQLAAMRPLLMRRYIVPSVHGEGLVERFAEVCAATGVEYAITHEAAGQRYAPFLSNVSQLRSRLLAGPAVDAALAALDARPVDQGANLALIEVKSPDGLLFRESAKEVWLASAVQVYLDLMRGESRAKDLAGHLRRERIGF